MITMKEPSFCFNSCDVGDPHYEMWRTMVGPIGMTPSQLAGKIAEVNRTALGSWGSPLVNVIINAHGYFGGIHIAGLEKLSKQIPMDKYALGVFGVLKPLGITTIWLISCAAARGETGKDFCATLAKVAGAEVIAADECQIVTTWQGIRLFISSRSNIDDFEGTVYSFTPEGHVVKGIDPEENYRRQMSAASESDKGAQSRYSITGIGPN
jgi:hypothetical protein